MSYPVCLLLTSTVNIRPHKCYLYQKNKEDRIYTYLKSIFDWLIDTSFNIVLVENSGYEFKELNYLLEKYKYRFELIVYSEEELESARFLDNNNSKGASEVYSINYAYNHSYLLQNSDFIIKITARYFIPELQSYLSNYNLSEYDVLTQNDFNRCEIVGCHSKHFSKIFDNNLLDETGEYVGHVEFVYRYRCSLYPKIIRCKVFHIEPTQRGGTPEIYNTI
jgi:hypothetical protein